MASVRDRIEYGPGWDDHGLNEVDDATGWQKFGAVIEAINGRDPGAYSRRMSNIENVNRRTEYRDLLLERAHDQRPLSPQEIGQMNLMREATTGQVVQQNSFPLTRKRRGRRNSGPIDTLMGDQIVASPTVMESFNQVTGQYVDQSTSWTPDAEADNEFWTDPVTGVRMQADRLVNQETGVSYRVEGSTRPQFKADSGDGGDGVTLTPKQEQDRQTHIYNRRRAIASFGISLSPSGEYAMSKKGKNLLKTLLNTSESTISGLLVGNLGKHSYAELKEMYEAIMTPLIGSDNLDAEGLMSRWGETGKGIDLFRKEAGLYQSTLLSEGEWDLKDAVRP